MAKKSDIPRVTIGRRCPLCGKVYALVHPNEIRPYCDECTGILKEIVNERRQNNDTNADIHTDKR